LQGDHRENNKRLEVTAAPLSNARRSYERIVKETRAIWEGGASE
jgi:hypothetical protein